jgi:excisionase family DNA binding protein
MKRPYPKGEWMLALDPLYTVRQAARELDVSHVTVYKLINEGQLGSLKIGRSRKITGSSLAAFIASRTAPPLTEEQIERLRVLLKGGGRGQK